MPGAVFAHPVGSIPACAGEPLAGDTGGLLIRVYPRVCGGTWGGGGRLPLRLGLSPRVRGNPVGTAGAGVAQGSIPACAGEPARRVRSLARQGVYPRVCGGTEAADA